METQTKQTTIAHFLAAGEQFCAAVQDLPEHLLECSATPGEWSIRQITHHVADDADVWCFALKRAIATPGAALRFEGFPGNEPWAAALGFDHRPVQTALDLLMAHRRMMAELAAWVKQDWEQCTVQGYDDKGNLITQWNIGQILEMLTGHLEEHLSTVHAIRARGE